MALLPEDRLEIINLYGRYSAAFDSGDAPGWAGLFTEDGCFEIVAAQRRYTGRSELEAFAGRRHQPGMLHFVSNITLDATDEGTAGRAAVLVLRAQAAGTRVLELGEIRDELAEPAALRVLNIGAYDDAFVRTADGWRFARRRFTSWLDPSLVDAVVADGRTVRVRS
jgi:hypothetical protein